MKTKRIFAIFMTLALAMSMLIATSLTSFAADGDKSITLTGGKAGHTYTLYQIFTGTVDGDELTGIQWGEDAPDALKSQYPTAAAAAKALVNGDARAFAQGLTLTGGEELTLSADGNVEFTNLVEGYYIIDDKVKSGSTPAEEGDYYSAFVVKVVKNVTGAMKGSGTTSDKKVVTQDGTAQDAAAYNIGDAVPFELNATTASNTAAYKKYHITFQDKQSTGLDAPTSFTVTVLGKTFTVPASGTAPAPQTTDNGTKITVSKVDPASGNTFAIKVEFEPTAEDAIYLDAECNSTPIKVTYTSVLNSQAEIGKDGNTNESYINYSNNPEDEDGGDEGKTPDDKVKVFTYKTVIDKVDEAGNALAGAGFTIYMEVAEDTEGAVKGSDMTFAEGVEHSKISADKYYVVKAMTTVGSSTNQFQFEGLADGKYILVETAVPDGYNAFKSTEFTITSTYDAEAADPQLLTLSGTDPFTDASVSGEDVADNGHVLESGEIYGEIENKSGAVLPETGGIGTIIFYVLGSALIIGCGIVLISRKRMQNR